MSKFRKADDNEGMIFRRTRKVAGIPEIEMGVYPVMFGYRIRVGIAGSFVMELDYCAGAQLSDVESIYSLTLAILNKKMDEVKEGDFVKKIFLDFPQQDVKPMFNDPACFMKLTEVAGKDVKKISLEGLDERRKQYFNSYL